jgi:hypothetical protein
MRHRVTNTLYHIRMINSAPASRACIQEKVPLRHSDGTFQIYCPTCRLPIPQAIYSPTCPELPSGGLVARGSESGGCLLESDTRGDHEFATKLEETRKRHAAVLAKQADVGGLVTTPDYSLPAMPGTLNIRE